MSDENRAILAGVRVLYVDDDDDTRAMMVLLLGAAGAVVVAVASVTDAIAEFRREQPDVLISDGGMPVQDGWAFIEQVRAWPHTCGGDIPAIAVTGRASTNDVAHSLLSGFDVHFSKPIDVTELVATIASLVGRSGVLTRAAR
jgi:CheY-like chemotaxis protein